MTSRSLGLLLCGGLAVPLAGCGSAVQEAPACPGLATVPNAADLTRYAGSGRDLRDLVLAARIAEVPATCTTADATHVRARVQVAVELRRGPAATSAAADVAYFVAVMKDGRVLDEQDYRVAGNFPANVDTRTVTTAPVEMLLPVNAQTSAAAYRIFVGFRLTPEELAANRQARQ